MEATPQEDCGVRREARNGILAIRKKRTRDPEEPPYRRRREKKEGTVPGVEQYKDGTRKRKLAGFSHQEVMILESSGLKQDCRQSKSNWKVRK